MYNYLCYGMPCYDRNGFYKELNVPEAMAYVMEVVGQGKVAGAIAAGAVIGLMAVIFPICMRQHEYFCNES